MEIKNIKRFEVLDVDNESVSIAFLYENSTKEIIIITKDAAKCLIKVFAPRPN